MTHTAVIKIGPLVTADVLRNPGSVRADRKLYQRGGLELLSLKGVPLLADHDTSRQVGTVHELINFPDTDGEWIAARATITDKPEWLKRGTRASFGFASLQDQQVGDWSRVLRGLISEVSILSPGVRPVEPLAQVALLYRTEAKPRATSGTPSEPDWIRQAQIRQAQMEAAARGNLIRPNIGHVLAVR